MPLHRLRIFRIYLRAPQLALRILRAKVERPAKVRQQKHIFAFSHNRIRLRLCPTRTRHILPASPAVPAQRHAMIRTRAHNHIAIAAHIHIHRALPAPAAIGLNLFNLFDQASGKGRINRNISKAVTASSGIQRLPMILPVFSSFFGYPIYLKQRLVARSPNTPLAPAIRRILISRWARLIAINAALPARLKRRIISLVVPKNSCPASLWRIPRPVDRQLVKSRSIIIRSRQKILTRLVAARIDD